ncbi:hypothetical protein C8Q80DRAFT_1264201 [Daedaleopsis nitida]|nr:hypothetical protein C8Q80DRAFT_1264201 [Daedaleopsis nitida]
MSYSGWATYHGLDSNPESDGESDIRSSGSESARRDPGTLDNICDSLSSLLKDDPGVTGAFAYSRTHNSWCNPGLDIDGFGSLGLPLNHREAVLLKDVLVANGSKAEKARALTPPSRGNTIDLPIFKVRPANRKWPAFLDRVVRDVCDALGVDISISKPRVQLFDLQLHDSRDKPSFVPLCDNACARAFATLVIVLPSTFDGGSLRVTYGDRSETYDYSVHTAANLTVLAWRTGAQAEFAPLSDGYHLALCYQIIPTTGSPVPAITLQDEVVSRLRQVLSRWNAMRSESKPAPTKLIHLLRNKYSRDVELRHDILKGADARTVLLLANVGKLHGFSVGLAHMTCVVHGCAANEECGVYKEYDHGEGSETEYEAGIAWPDPFLLPDSTKITVQSLVDMDGGLVRATLDHDYGTEFMLSKSALVENIVATPYDKQYYKPAESSLDWDYEFRRVYHRNVVVLWPEWADFEVVNGPNAIQDACERLRAHEGSNPAPEDTQLVENVLANATAPHYEAILTSACRVALMWNNFELWLRTVQACNAARSISAVGTANVQMAVGTFGFQQMQPYLEQLVDGEPSDVTALQFMDDMERWCEGQDSLELIETVLPWVAAQRTKRYDVLQVSGQDECAALAELVLKGRGGAVIFKQKILPMMKTITDSSVLIRYLACLQSDRLVKLAPAMLSEAIRDLLHEALNHLNIPPASSSNAPPEKGLLLQAQAFMLACSLAGENDLASAGLTKLKDISAVGPGPHARTVYFPLITYLTEEEKRAPVDLTEFCEYALLSWLDAVDAMLTPTPEDVELLFRIVSIGKHWVLLTTRITPKLVTLELGEPSLRTLLNALHTNREHIGDTAKTLMLLFLKKWAGLIPVENRTTLETIEFPVMLGLPEACSFVFEPSISQPIMNADYVRHRLGPMLETIYAVCSKHSVPVTSPHFAPVIRQIMVHWATEVMDPCAAPNPEETKWLLHRLTSSWTCGCAHCKPVREFLLYGDQKEKEFQVRRAKDVRHVEQYLTHSASSIATWKNLKPANVQRLMVTKADKHFNQQQWKKDQEKGVQLLNAISTNKAELQAVLGGDYESVVAELNTPDATPAAQAPQSPAMLPHTAFAHQAAHMFPGYGTGVPHSGLGKHPAQLPYDDPPTKRRKM